MRAYLTAPRASSTSVNSVWNTFRVLYRHHDEPPRTNDDRSAAKAPRASQPRRSVISFLQRVTDYVWAIRSRHVWQDGNGREVRLM